MNNLTIWKFIVPDPSEDIVSIELPENAKILSYQFQDIYWVIWALVDSKAKMEQKKFLHI